MKSNGANDAAFPRPCGRLSDEEFHGEQDGLTVREWYAGMAMQGILAGGMTLKSSLPLSPAEVADGAFNLADAMLSRARRAS